MAKPPSRDDAFNDRVSTPDEPEFEPELEPEQGRFVPRLPEAAISKAARAAKTTGAAANAVGAGSIAAGKGMQATGKGMQATGKGMQAAGQMTGTAGTAGMKSGKATLKAGAAASKTGIGAIVGVPAMVGGAALTAGGAAAKGVGKTTEAAGKATVATGKTTEAAGKTTTKVGEAAKDAGTATKSVGGKANSLLGKNADGSSTGPVAKVADKADLWKRGIDAVGEGVGSEGLRRTLHMINNVTDKALKHLGKAIGVPGLHLIKKSAPAAIAFSMLTSVLITILIISLITGGGGGGFVADPDADPDSVVFADERSGSWLSAYRSAGGGTVPWMLLAGYGFTASQHNTVNPYLDPANTPDGAFPSTPGVSIAGDAGQGPLLASQWLIDSYQIRDPQDGSEVLSAMAQALNDWADYAFGNAERSPTADASAAPVTSSTTVGGETTEANPDAVREYAVPEFAFDVTGLIRFGNFDRDVFGDDEEWQNHLAFWAEAVRVLPLIDVPDSARCAASPASASIEQILDFAFRCAIVRDPSLSPQIIIPETGRIIGVLDPEDPESEDVLRYLIQEAVIIHTYWRRNQQDVVCESGDTVGGPLPILSLTSYRTVTTTDPGTGRDVVEYVVDDASSYDRCDGWEAAQLWAKTVLEAESVPVADRAGDEWQRAMGAYWLIHPNILSSGPNNTFATDGPESAGAWEPPNSEACDVALRGFFDRTLPRVNGFMPSNDEDRITAPNEPLPASWNLLANAGPYSETLDVEYQQLRDTVPSWNAVESECSPPLPLSGSDPAYTTSNVEPLWQSTVFEALSNQIVDVEGLRREAVDGGIAGFIEFERRSGEFDVGGRAAEWGVTGVLPRLTNPRVSVDVAPWFPLTSDRTSSQVISAALNTAGEGCASLTTVAAGVSGSGSATATQDEFTLAKAAAQVSYDAGFYGEDLVIAVAVVGAESRWRPGVNNLRSDGTPSNNNGTVDYGLFQINTIWIKSGLAPPPDEIYDPQINANLGFAVMRERAGWDGEEDRWKAWATFNDGLHLQHMDTARRAIAETVGAGYTVQKPDTGSVTVPQGGGSPSGTLVGGSLSICGAVSGASFPAGQAGPWGGHSNGQIPTNQLCRMSDAGQANGTEVAATLIRCDAAQQFVAMNAAYREALGHSIPRNSGYRSLQRQIELRNSNCSGARSNGVWDNKPCSPATATPGTSNHGWALAVDMTTTGCGVDNGCGFATAHYRWFRDNAARFGFYHPGWAQAGSGAQEYWHWEYGQTEGVTAPTADISSGSTAA